MAGVHGEKIAKLLSSSKLPTCDKPQVAIAYQKYENWVNLLQNTHYNTVKDAIEGMVASLNDYKYFIDVNLIFDSKEDFLYRQKGQLKLDNTIMEEFLPLLVGKCLTIKYGGTECQIGSQAKVFSSLHFESSLANPVDGGGIQIKSKDQDFAIYRPLYLKASHNRDMTHAVAVETCLGYVCAEIKTNLDKTMFQEASATAHDVRVAVSGAKYYLLADFLDMTPISTATTDIEEILITRKAKRIGSGIRKAYSERAGRIKGRDYYTSYLRKHPYATDVFERFIQHILDQVASDDLSEESALETGYF